MDQPECLREERLKKFRAEVVYTKESFGNRDKDRAEYLGLIKQRHGSISQAKYEVTELPPLPPPVPLPQYGDAAAPISQDDTALEFYAACDGGLLEEVVEFVESHGPNQATRQFGLEQACQRRHVDTVRYLLEHGTILHVIALDRFSIARSDPISAQLIEVFIQSGWHPNQVWESTLHPKYPLYHMNWRRYKPILALLLKHGGNPNLHYYTDNDGKTTATCKSGEVISYAIMMWDPSLIDLLIAHGARPEHAALLHSIAQWTMQESPRPFAPRRPMAEHLLDLGAVDVNEPEEVALGDYPGSPRTSLETPFSYACLAQDWEYAEWLLEHGANPDALDKKAFLKRSIFEERKPPSSPVQVTKLVEKVRLRQAMSELKAED